MSNIPQIAKENIKDLQKNLIYLYAQSNTIIEFCLSAEIAFQDNKNELQNYDLKKSLSKMKKVNRILKNLLD